MRMFDRSDGDWWGDRERRRIQGRLVEVAFNLQKRLAP
jgi:hypothetical protein